MSAGQQGQSGRGRVDLQAVGPLPAEATVRVYDHVYRLVRHAVLSRRIPPGGRIVEAALAEQLEVSRTPVRDALRRLESEGLLERGGRRSLAATAFSPEDVEDIFLLRRMLDGLTAELAAHRVKAHQWEQLRSLALALGPAVERSGTSSYEFSAAHDRLHRAIYELTFAPKVAGVLVERLMALVEIAGGLSYGDPHDEEPVVAQHLVLLDALASGDPEEARQAAEEHVATAYHAAMGSVGLASSPGEP